MTITKFIKFHGNSKYFAGLTQTDNDEYILVYGLIGKMNMKSEIINLYSYYDREIYLVFTNKGIVNFINMKQYFHFQR